MRRATIWILAACLACSATFAATAVAVSRTGSSPPPRVNNGAFLTDAQLASTAGAPADWATEPAPTLAAKGWVRVTTPGQLSADGKGTVSATYPQPVRTAGVKSWGFPQIGPKCLGFIVNFSRSMELIPGVYKTAYVLHNQFNWCFNWFSPYGAVVYNIDNHHTWSDRYTGVYASGGQPSTYPFDYNFSCGLARQCHHTTARQTFTVIPPLNPLCAENAEVWADEWPNGTAKYDGGIVAGTSDC